MVCWATDELKVPTTPTTELSDASLLAARPPTSGLPLSSSAAMSRRQPSILLASFASLMARSTELRIPRPNDVEPASRGTITPIRATFLSSPPLSSASLPQAARATTATMARVSVRQDRRFVRTIASSLPGSTVEQ